MNNRTFHKVADEFDFHLIETHPILDIAARFWVDERYNAFKTCYTLMRPIDDLVDGRKAVGKKISEAELEQMTAEIRGWVDSIDIKIPLDEKQKRLQEAIKEFQLPFWPWEGFSQAMLYDLHHDRFRTINEFLKYAEGAAVGPGSIFLHLCGAVRENGSYRPPDFDVKRGACPLAIFSYLVHIVRDFQKDQKDNINFFAEDLIEKNGLTVEMLREIAEGGEIGPGFRNLMKEYSILIEIFQEKARDAIDELATYLAPRYLLSLEIIYKLYTLVFERFDCQNGRFDAEELNPSPQEFLNRIYKTISKYESNAGVEPGVSSIEMD